MIKCSVIILNYQGEKVIDSTVNSVLNQDFPPTDFEIIIVDNHSTDNSRHLIRQMVKEHPQIRSLFLDKNYGFARGNNRGIDISLGNYICLLNNDCQVESNWLSSLYQTAVSDPQIFSVTSKIRLYPKYYQLKIPQNSEDIITDVYLSDSHLCHFSNSSSLKIPFIATNNWYLLDIPFDPNFDQTVNLKIITANLPSTKLTTYFQKKPAILLPHVSSNQITFKLDCRTTSVTTRSYHKIQNAGSMPFPDGYSRDIGAVVTYMTQNYESDTGQFDHPKEIYSGCGAAILFSKELLVKLGGLNNTFFMYYEDLELCERALLSGYKNIYCPEAIANHLHALTSHEWSDFFIYHTEKGRLIHLYFNFPLKIFLAEYFKFTLKAFGYIFRRKTNYIKIALDLLFDFNNLTSIKQKQQLNFIPNSINTNYQKIISGYWYVH